MEILSEFANSQSLHIVLVLQQVHAPDSLVEHIGVDLAMGAQECITLPLGPTLLHHVSAHDGRRSPVSIHGQFLQRELCMLVALSVLFVHIEIFLIADDVGISMGGKQAAHGPIDFLGDDMRNVAGTVDRLRRIVSEGSHIDAGGIIDDLSLAFIIYARLSFD